MLCKEIVNYTKIPYYQSILVFWLLKIFDFNYNYYKIADFILSLHQNALVTELDLFCFLTSGRGQWMWSCLKSFLIVYRTWGEKINRAKVSFVEYIYWMFYNHWIMLCIDLLCFLTRTWYEFGLIVLSILLEI